MPDKVQLNNRAPETQAVLRRINGWSINWGITVVMMLFAILFVAAFQIKFDEPYNIPVQVQSTSNVVSLADKLPEGLTNLTLTLEGNSYLLNRENGANFRAERPLPATLPFPFPIEAVAIREANILAIIFKGIF